MPQMPAATDSPAYGLVDSPCRKHPLPGFDKLVIKQDSDPNVVVSTQSSFPSLVKGQQSDIQSLRFSCGPLTVKTMQSFIQNSWPALCSLDFSASQLDQHHMKHLAECSCPNLRNLDLSSNNLGEEAMFRLAAMIFPCKCRSTMLTTQLPGSSLAMQLLVSRKFLGWHCILMTEATCGVDCKEVAHA